MIENLYRQINDLVIMDRYKKNNKYYYKLSCSYGHIVEVRCDSLKEDRYCKVCKRLVNRNKRPPTIKKGFTKGQLKVLETLPHKPYGKPKTTVLCTCGNVKEMLSCNLIKTAQNYSCGECKPYYKEGYDYVEYFYPHQEGIYKVIIDYEDVEILESSSWTIHKDLRNCYVREGNSDRTFLHRVLMGCPEDMFIDHINGNGLDNRRKNLRVVDKVTNNRNTKLNRRNTTGQMGVIQRKDTGKWRAWIGNGGDRVYLGQFDTKEDAVLVRKMVEVELGYHENHGRRMDSYE